MITRFHYDRETLHRFLNDETGDAGSCVASHVECCEACQSEMESLLQNGITMETAGELLSEPLAVEFSADDEEAAETDVLAHLTRTILQPSTYPESLGRFARFEIMELLGHGGMGIVMRGYDTLLSRHSAIKVLAPEFAGSAAARKRFEREAKSAAAVVHPHVVPIQTVDQHRGLPYLVMPVVEGQSLDVRIRKTGSLNVLEAVRIAAQVAQGLAAAHQQGLVHRDIKPANILLENGVERVQITDFGLARAIDDASMTHSGVIAGTPQYMSPEQAHGDSIDHRSDLFSLGSLIYFMLAGHSPFRANTTMGVLNRIGNDQPRSLRTVNSDVPRWLEDIVMKLLARSPDQRYQTADEVAEVLQQWHAHLQQPDQNPPPQPLPSEFGRHRSVITKQLVAAIGMLILLLAGVLIVLETNKGTLSIRCESDTVPVRITQNGKVVRQLTVSQQGTSVRIAAGSYVVEVDEKFDGVRVEDGVVSLRRGETETVRIESTETNKSRRAGKIRHSDAGGPDPESLFARESAEPGESQVLFDQPAGMVVERLRSVNESTDRRVFGSVDRVGTCPCRVNLAGNVAHHFRLTDVPGFERASFRAFVQVPAVTEAAAEWLQYNVIAIGITDDVFAQVTTDGSAVMVIRLADPKSQQLAAAKTEIMSDSSIDVIREADGHMPILAVVRLTAGPDRKPWEQIRFMHQSHEQGIDCLRFSPNGQMVASVSDDNSVRLWDIASGALLQTVSRPVNCNRIAFSPVEELLAIAGGDHGTDPQGELVIWNLRTGSVQALLDHRDARFQIAAAFSPDGRRLASGGKDGFVRLWDVESGELLHELDDHEGLVSQVAFAPDGTQLVSAGFDDTARLWDAVSGELLGTFRGHQDAVRDLALISNGERLVTASEDGTVRVWDMASQEQVGRLDSHHGWVLSVAGSPDGRYVATGGADRRVIVWDMTSEHFSSQSIPRQGAGVTSVAFSPDGRLLAVAGAWNGFQIWKRRPARTASDSVD